MFLENIFLFDIDTYFLSFSKFLENEARIKSKIKSHKFKKIPYRTHVNARVISKNVKNECGYNFKNMKRKSIKNHSTRCS